MFPYLSFISSEIILIGILTILLWWYSIKKQSYWKDRNIPYVKPLPFIGSLIDVLTTPLHVVELKRYFSLGPIYGLFEGNRPVLVVSDPKLIRDIFVKDFAYFQNRRSFQTGNKLNDQSLLFNEGESWRRIRSIVTPTFTSGKLKRIFSIYKDCSKALVQNFKASAQKQEPIDAKRFLGAFLMDIIARSAFSTKIDALNDPNNKFIQYANKSIGKNFKFNMFFIMIFSSWPRLMKCFKLTVIDSDVMEFFKNASERIISERKRTKQTRNDFLQLLLDTAEETEMNEKNAVVENENDLTANYRQDTAGQKVFNRTFKKNLTNEELVSQCVTFFLSAYDTTTSLLASTFYALATNEDIQKKAYQEIAQYLEETNGELTYEVLHKMKYMDNIISESLRLYNPSVRISRRVEKKYKLGDTGITLEKDTIVLVPSMAIHRDPKYYPDPEKFDPDRFSAEEIAKRDPYVYLPFGYGPRHCVGMRFALLTAKVCLVHIISCFIIKTCPQTKIPMEFELDAYFILHPKDVTVALEIRNDSPLVCA